MNRLEKMDQALKLLEEENTPVNAIMFGAYAVAAIAGSLWGIEDKLDRIIFGDNSVAVRELK